MALLGEQEPEEAASLGEGLLYDRFTLSLHLTDVCNASCRFCGENSHSRKSDLVTTESLLDFLRKNAGGKWTAVNIHGGEPTLRPDLLEILREIRELGYERIILQTNALRLANARFCAQVQGIGVDVYTSGFHGADPETARSITGVSRGFELALKGFENIKRDGSTLRTTTVVCSLNVATLQDVTALCVDVGADHVNLSAMQPGGSAEADLDRLLVPYRQAYPHLVAAIDQAVAADRIVTLEGFPYCAVAGRERHQVAWAEQQLKVLYRTMVFEDFNAFLNATMRAQGEPCQTCVLRGECGGVYKGYLDHYGWDEFTPYVQAPLPGRPAWV
jgi:sulfatase maturation enzyme AslB (radical SAM superfamily)